MVRVGAVFVWRYNAIVLHGHQTDAQGIGYGRLLGLKVFVLNSYPNSIMSVRIKNIAVATVTWLLVCCIYFGYRTKHNKTLTILHWWMSFMQLLLLYFNCSVCFDCSKTKIRDGSRGCNRYRKLSVSFGSCPWPISASPSHTICKKKKQQHS